MDDLNILVRAKLSSTKEEIETQIRTLSKQITEAISVKLKVDAKDLTMINDTMDKIKKATSQTGSKITIFNEKDLKDQGTKYKQGVMKTIEDVEKYLKGAFHGRKFDLGTIVKDSSGNIKSFEASIKLANNQLEKVKFNLAEIARESAKTGKVSTMSGYVLDSSKLSRIEVKPEQIFDRKKLEAEGRQFFISSSNIVERVKREFKSLGEVDVNFLKNSKQNIIGFTASVTKADGIVRQLTFDMAKIKSGESTQSGYIFSSEKLIDKNAGSNLNELKNKMQSFTNQLERMKVRFTSPATGITNPEHLNNLITKYNQVKNIINQVQQSSTNLSNEQRRYIVQNLADLRMQITQYKDLQRIMKTSASNSSSLSAKDVSLFKDTMANKIAGLQVGKEAVYARPEIIAETKRLTSEVEKFGTVGGKSAKELNLQFAQLRTSVRAVTAEISKVNSAADGLGVTFIKDMFKLGIWAGAATVFYAPFRALSDGLQYVYQMDTAITDLSKVVDFSSNQLNEMADAAINLGKQLGKSSVEIMQGMAEFGRVSKNQNDIIELTRVAAMASNVTTMSAAEAAKDITSSMITFGIEAKDSMKILDSWNEIQNNFRVSAEDLAASISKIGAASKVAKVDMEDLEGITTAIVQSTGISGNEAGTAIKSFMSKLYRTDMSDPEELGRTAKALKEIAGVDVKDASGNLKGFNDIISETADAWQTMSEQEKIATAQSMGSTYHYSKFVALMENYSTKIDAATMARNSENSALVENAKKLDSIQGRLGLLKVASEEFWRSFIDSSTVKNMVSALTYLISTFANLKTIIFTVVSAFALWKGSNIVAYIGKQIVVMNAYRTSLAIAAGGTEMYTVVTRQAIASTNIFKAATLGLWNVIKANPFVFIVGAIATAVIAFDVFNQKQEEAIQKQKESIDVYKQQQTQISSLIDTYKQNAELAGTDDDAKQQLIETEKQLKEVLGDTALGLDLQSGSIDENIKKIKELNVEKQKDFIEQQKGYAEGAKNALNSKKVYSATSWPETAFEGSMFRGTPEKALEHYKSLLNKINEDLHNGSLILNNDTIKQSNQISEIIQTIETEIEEYKNTIGTLDEAYKMVAQNSVDNLDKLSDKQKEVYDNIKDNLTFTNEDQYKKNLQETINILSNWDGKSLDDLNDKLHKVDASLPSLGDNASKTSGKIKAVEVSSEDLAESLKDVTSVATDVSKAMQEYNETGKLSQETIADLIIKYPELIDQLKIENGQLVLNKEAIQGLLNIRISEMKVALENSKNLTIVEAENTKKRIANLILEAKAIQNRNAVMSTSSLGVQKFNNLTEVGLELSRYTIQQSKIREADAKIASIETLLGNIQTSAYSGNYPSSSKSGGSGSKSGGSGSKSGSTADKTEEPSYTSPVDAIVQEIEAQANLTKTKSEAIKAELEQAKSSKDYSLVLQKTTEYIQSQQTQLQQLAEARNRINYYKDDQLKNSQFGDTSRWFNDLNEASTTYIYELNAASAETQKFMESEFAIMQKLRKAWVDNKNAMEEITQSIKDMRAEIADDAISAYKSALELEKDLVLKTIDAEMDALDKAHDKKMKQYDEEYEAYEKIIQAKLESIDHEKDEDDYNKQLLKAQSEAQEIQSKINVLSMDNSMEAKAKIAELQKQLAEKLEEISQMQNDREVELRKQNLEDMLNNEKEIVDAKKDSAEKTYETAKDALEQERIDREYEFDLKINDEKKFAQMRLDIIGKNVTDIEALIKQSIDNINAYSSESLKTIGVSQGTVDAVTGNLDTATGNLGTIAKTVVFYATEIDKTNAQSVLGNSKFDYIKNANPNVTPNDLVIGGSAVMHPTGAVTSENWLYGYDAEATKKAIEEWKRRHPEKFDTGGYTGSFDDSYGRLAILHSKELVLNKTDTSNILKAVEFARNFITNFKLPELKLPDFGKVATNPSLSMQNNIVFNIDGSNGISEADLQKASKYVLNQIQIGRKKLGYR